MDGRSPLSNVSATYNNKKARIDLLWYVYISLVGYESTVLMREWWRTAPAVDLSGAGGKLNKSYFIEKSNVFCTNSTMRCVNSKPKISFCITQDEGDDA